MFVRIVRHARLKEEEEKKQAHKGVLVRAETFGDRVVLCLECKKPRHTRTRGTGANSRAKSQDSRFDNASFTRYVLVLFVFCVFLLPSFARRVDLLSPPKTHSWPPLFFARQFTTAIRSPGLTASKGPKPKRYTLYSFEWHRMIKKRVLKALLFRKAAAQLPGNLLGRKWKVLCFLPDLSSLRCQFSDCLFCL